MFVLLTGTGLALFRDRQEAGRRLATRLEAWRDQRPMVLGLARGGVPVASEVARALDAPLDVMLVRKLGAPIQPELALGAIGEEGVQVLNEPLIASLGVEPAELEATVAHERAELERRQRLYRGDRQPVAVARRTVILVDDGIATGSSAVAAARVLRARGAEEVVLAVPVGPPGVEQRIGGEVDQVVCLESPAGFLAVGAYYEEFGQTSDEEVEELLRRAHEEEKGEECERAAPVATAATDPPRHAGGIDFSQLSQRQVEIPTGEVLLRGELRRPPQPLGLVIFAHGSGSSRLSPRNVQVAVALGSTGLATLLFDLLTEHEAADRENVFDIEFLAERLVTATRWAQADPELRDLPLGYFGASTGAAAALCAAAELPRDVRAVVSRGGRPDLAAGRLAEVRAPTLLIAGGADRGVIELNQQALATLRCPKRLVIVPEATHLFEEPGALAQVAEHAARWFAAQLAPRELAGR